LLLIGIGFLGAFGLGFIPEQWVLGAFGMVPLALGIKSLIKGEDNDKEEEEAEKSLQKYKSLGIQVLAITIGLGADDLGLYIQLFTTQKGWKILLMMLIFLLGTAVLCWISYKLKLISKLTDFVEKYERFITGIVFIAIGIYIMYECGTFAHFIL
jgi:cadmium resistance transport/sequestration family protein